jgi:chemotaxis methyl-accepting protein methylase
VKTSNEECGLLVASLNNTFSEFFRNTLTFAYLEQIVLPGIIERKKREKHREIRIWSAACASGQEPYSIAILIDELIRVQNANLSCHIFATDINPSEITVAKKGDLSRDIIGKSEYEPVKYIFQAGCPDCTSISGRKLYNRF